MGKTKLDWFVPRKQGATLHDKIKFLLHPEYEQERRLLQQWIDEFSSPDGETKAVDQFQATFHSVFWELYLNQLFHLSKARVDTKQLAPDFKIQTPDLTYFVEATVANIAADGRPESKRTERDVYGGNDHYEILDESISRVLRRVRVKSGDFNGYNEEVKKSPFIIAVADFSQVNYGQASYYAPLAVLYNAYYDPDDKKDFLILCDDSFDREYKYKERHGGNNQKGFSLGLFASDKNKHISALIYTCMLSLGKLTSLVRDHGPQPRYVCVEREAIKIIRFSGSAPGESLGDGVFVFHNPFAEHPLDDDFMPLKGVSHVRFMEEDNLIEISCNGTSPLIRRRTGSLTLLEEQIHDLGDFIAVPIPKPVG